MNIPNISSSVTYPQGMFGHSDSMPPANRGITNSEDKNLDGLKGTGTAQNAQQINEDANANQLSDEDNELELGRTVSNFWVVTQNHVRDNPPPNENLQGAVNGTGLKAFFSRIGTWLSSVFSQPERMRVPEEITVDTPWNTPVSFTRTELEAMIDDVPDDQRAAAINDLPNKLASRIREGSKVLTAVLAGSRWNNPATAQETSDILLCLSARAKTFGEGFARGAFSVEDPNGRLANFLANSSDSYVRRSTHLDGLQKDHPHRGIDMPVGIDGLPNGMRTVLFGVIPPFNGMNQRIFIKPEEYGCRLFRPAKAIFTNALGPSRGISLLHDIKNSAGHVWMTVRSWFVKGTSTRKERIPKGVEKAFEALVKACKDAGQSDAVAILKNGSPLDKHQGIRAIKANLEKTLFQRILTNSKNDEITNKYNLLQNELEKYDKHGNAKARIGNEVMLESVDFGDQPRVR